MLRLTVVLGAPQAGADGSYMSLVMHHIIMDGMSLDIIMSDLLAAYTSFQLKKPPQLSALQVQYIDFTHWQQQQLNADDWKPQVGTPALSSDSLRPPGLDDKFLHANTEKHFCVLLFAHSQRVYIRTTLVVLIIKTLWRSGWSAEMAALQEHSMMHYSCYVCR